MIREPDSPPDPFDDLAARLADGDAIDWEKVGASRRFQGQEIAALKLIGQLRLTPDVALASPPDPAATAPQRGDAPPRPTGPLPLEQGFELISELGRGAFATVWRARDKALGREVALKLLNEKTLATPAARARFIAEARVLASLDHPNIVRIHSIDEHEGKLRLSLELLDGQTLDQWLRNSGPLSAAEAAQIGADLCRGLAAIHGRGLVHGDVKPANVMRASGGRIVLLDFGITRAARAPAELQRAEAAGTPLYMAPEQFDDPPHAGPKSDLFALGVLLYWLVARRYPVEAASIEALIDLLREGKVVPLLDRCPDVAPEFAAIVGKALASNEDERFESAGAMEIALRRFIAGEALRDGGADGRGVAPARGPLWIATAAALLLVGGLAWTWVNHSMWPGHGEPAAGPPSLLVAAPRLLRDRDTDLHSRDHVRVGDELTLEVEAKQAVWVYVVNQDSAGTINVLFPTEHSAFANPIAAGMPIDLPGPGRPDPKRPDREPGMGHWLINATPDGGGSEDFFVVVASAADPPLEQFIARLPPETRLEQLDAATRDLVTRSIGAIAEEQKPAAPAPGAGQAGASKARLRLRDELQKIAAKPDENGIRIERYTFHLLNP